MVEPVKRSVPLDDMTELMSAAWECAQDLEAELGDRYSSRDTQPVQQRRYDRDMEPVRRLRAVYEKLKY